MMRAAACLVVMALLAGVGPRGARAEEGFQTVLKDGAYGGLTGALVGGAVLLLREDPGDHLDLIGRGAAIGAIVGVAFGLVTVSRAFVEISDGRVIVGIPIPEVSIRPVSAAGTEVIWSSNLLVLRY